MTIFLIFKFNALCRFPSPSQAVPVLITNKTGYRVQASAYKQVNSCYQRINGTLNTS